jgi:cutinase
VVAAVLIANGPTLGFVNPMPTAVADHVAAVAVFGNPSIRLLGGPLTALSPQYGYKTIDLCNGADPVCSTGDDRPAHSLYVEAGLTTPGVQFVANRLTTEAPIATLAGQTHG